MPTLDTTVAGPDANSYATIAEMDAFVDDEISGAATAAWLALSDDDKARYLISATRQLDRAHCYIGDKTTDMTEDAAQALKFPRFSLNYAGGKANIEAFRSSGSYAVDERVKRAQMHQALFNVQQIIVEGAAEPVGGTTRAKLQAEGVESIRIGNTAEKYTGKSNVLCHDAGLLLMVLIRKTSRM